MWVTGKENNVYFSSIYVNKRQIRGMFPDSEQTLC